MILIHHGDRVMIFRGRGLGTRLVGKETHRKAQKHTKCSYTQSHESRYRCHAFLGLKRTSSVLGTARLQHGFGSVSFTLAGEKVPSRAGSVPARFIKASWASTARLGTTLARFGHVYTATANRAEPCWYRAGTVSSGSVNAV